MMDNPKMQCGGCGEDKFLLYIKDNNSGLYSGCTKCESVSEFSLDIPILSVLWVEEHQPSTGIACVFDSNKHYLRVIPNEKV